MPKKYKAKNSTAQNKETQQWEEQSYYSQFETRHKCWDYENREPDNFSDNIIMPKYSPKQIPFIETPHYEMGEFKQETLESMIENWRQINKRIQSEKVSTNPNTQKITKLENRLNMLTHSLLRDREYITQNIKHISLNELFQTHTK